MTNPDPEDWDATIEARLACIEHELATLKRALARLASRSSEMARRQADDRYELEARLLPPRPGPLGW